MMAPLQVIKKGEYQGFPGGTVVKTSCFQSRGRKTKKKTGIKKSEDYFRDISLPFPNKIFPEATFEEYLKEMELSCNSSIVVGSICSDRLLHIIKIIDPNTISTF